MKDDYTTLPAVVVDTGNCVSAVWSNLVSATRNY